jgi:hypothetical protein
MATKNFGDNLNDVIESQPMKAVRTYEKVKTTFIFVIMTIICLICIIVGIFLIKASTKKMSITANVTKNSECSIVESYDNKNRKISSMVCNTTVEFTVNDTKYTGVLNTEGTKYNQNNPINIYYDKENPNNISYSNAQKYIGIGLITFFSIVFILLCIDLYATYNSKMYSSIKGVSEIAGMGSSDGSSALGGLVIGGIIGSKVL